MPEGTTLIDIGPISTSVADRRIQPLPIPIRPNIVAAPRPAEQLPRELPLPSPNRPSMRIELDRASWVELYLKNRANTLKRPLTPQALAEQTRSLTKLVSSLSPENTGTFFKDSYVAENLEYFFSIDPIKINLALQTSADIKNLTRTQEINPQFLPAINLGAFVALEMIANNGLRGLSSASIQRSLELKRTQRSISWGQESLLRHTLGYLSRINPNLQGRELERALATEIALDLNQKLTTRTEEMQWLGQSQGIEIEVLKYVTRSKNAAERGIAPKWLPRGIPLESHARRDWNLLPLLGVKEDVGERAHQVYEMATHPTDTMASQTTIMYELMLGGFITENMLSDETRNKARKGREGYSLHVSTVFPRAIITSASMREYKDMARCLAGAFASDQRIAFGGFMSGGEEIANKSASGNLIEVGKRTVQDGSIPRDLALIEVRNLDVTLRDQYPVLLQKEVLDYSFRCAWEKYTHPHTKLGLTEEFAARQWKIFSRETQKLFGKYGISTEQLYTKYGPKWENFAWKEMSDIREKNPQFKSQLATLIRKQTSQLRIFKKENESSQQAETTRKSVEPARYLMVEPLGQQADRVYLSGEERDKIGIQPGETITIRYGDQIRRVIIAPAKIRGDGTTEGLQESPFRVSSNVLQEFKLPNGFAVFPLYNRQTKELSLNPIEAEDSPVIKLRESRKLRVEPKGLMPDRFYMTQEDRQKLGLRPGQQIYVRFGEARKAITVAEAKQRDDGTTESPLSGNWRVSSNVLKEFGLPDGVSLRARYDKISHEFSFGPSMAHLNHIRDLGNGDIEVQGRDSFFKQAAKQAELLGVFTCLIDVNQQNPDVVRSGLVDAYIPDPKVTGKWKKIRIPTPDVAYDKDITRPNETGERLKTKFSFEITPQTQQALTKDKLKFANMFESSKIASYHPETIALGDTNALERFLTTHSSVMIKPQFGQQGRGIMTVDRDTQGYVVRYNTVDQNKKNRPVEIRVKTVAELLTATQAYRGERKYIAQKKINLAKYKYEHKGTTHTRVPEIRLTVQRGINGQPRITGMITRLHDPQLTGEEYLENPTVTLGKMFPTQAEGILTDVRKLGISSLKLFEGKTGKFSGEITFDIGIEADGSPIVIEANSKAETRAMYNHESVKNYDAAYHSTAKPTEYALFLTDMN